MGIKEDLHEARTGATSLVPVAEAVANLARVAGISVEDAAHWLALKGVHKEVRAYRLMCAGYVREELPLTKNESGVMYYESVYKALVDLVHPLGGFVDVLDPQPQVAWLRADIDDFIRENGGMKLHAPAPESVIRDADGEAMGTVELRKTKLLKAIDDEYDRKNIPMGSKAKLRTRLRNAEPRIFTDATFDKAWAALSESGQIGITGKEIYGRKGGIDESEDSR